MALKSKLSRLLVVGELRSLDPPFHHAPFPVDEFQFGEAQKVAGMIDHLLPRIVWQLCHTHAGKSAGLQRSSDDGPATAGACRS